MGAVINEAGRHIITTFEGWSSTPYRDPVGIPTIGHGSIWGIDGSRVDMDHKTITPDEGAFLLDRELRHAENAVAKLIAVPVTINQFSAVVSLVYNIGSGNFQASTLRMKLNRRDYVGAANEFWKWRRAGGIILRGLVRRRAMEADLFQA